MPGRGELPKTTWRGIAVDGGRIYIVGQRQVLDSNLGTAKLNYHASKLINHNPSAGTADPIIARLDASNGGLQWAEEFGSTDMDELNNETVAVLPSGKVLVGSNMAGPYTPDNHEPSTEPDVGIARFTPGGVLESVKQFDRYAAIQSLVADGQGNVLAGMVADATSTPHYYVKMNSTLQAEIETQMDADLIKQPIPYPAGSAVVYGASNTKAFIEGLDAGGNKVWKHLDGGSTEAIQGTGMVQAVRMPGGGIAGVAENASAIRGLPYLEIYADDGTPLLIDSGEKTAFFQFEDDKKGRGYPTAIEAYRDSQGKTWIYTLGVTASEWANRDDPDGNNPGGGKDMWMTGMTLQCHQVD